MNVRILGTDSIATIISKMSEGNPGAATALMEILKDGKGIDPDDFMGGLNPILQLDMYHIYGTDIYVLWSDICDRDTTRTLAVLRAAQLGFLQPGVLAEACSKQDYSGKKLVDVDNLLQQVKERLPNFGQNSKEGL